MAVKDSLLAGVASAAVSAAAYAAFLAWDTHYYYGSDGQQHGPYHAWQVAGLVVVLAVSAFLGGRRRHPMAVVAAATVVITVAFSISGATSSQDDGLWPIGSALAFIGTAAGMSFVGLVGWSSTVSGRAR
jgi:cytochrome bd-type quinol oxidase subunit 2